MLYDAHFTWNPVSGAEGYHLYLDGYGGIDGDIIPADPRNPSITQQLNLEPDTEYTFEISAFDSTGEGPRTSRTVRTAAMPLPGGSTLDVSLVLVGGGVGGPPSSDLDQITGLNVSSIDGSSSVNLAWDQSTAFNPASITATGTDSFLSATSFAVTLPAANAGDIYYVVFAANSSADLSAADWTKEEADGFAPFITGAIFTKVATGADTLTVQLSTGSATAAAAIYVITGASDVEVAPGLVLDNGVDKPWTPASPAYGSASTLFIGSLVGGDDDLALFSFPAGWGNTIEVVSGGGVNNGCNAALCSKAALGTEGPDGAFEYDADDINETAVAWQAAVRPTAINLNGYDVYRSVSGADSYQKVNTTTVFTESFSDTSIQPENDYDYYVVAVGPSGQSPQSDIVTASIPADTPPAQVSGVAASLPTSSSIRITWASNTETDLSGYRVERSLNGTTGWAGIEEGLLDNVTTQVTDGSLSEGTTYYYRVIALDTGGNESTPSLVVSSETSTSTLTYTHYIDTSGSDSNDGLTPGTAWATFGHARSAAGSGAVISVAAGVYSHSETSPPSLTSPQHFVANGAVRLSSINYDYTPTQRAANVIFDGMELYDPADGVSVFCRGWYVTDFEVRNATIHADYYVSGPSSAPSTRSGVSIRYCDNYVVNHCRIYEVGVGVKIQDSPNTTVKDNYITNKANSGIQLSFNSEGSLVEGNRIHKIDHNDADFDASPHGSLISVRSAQITIRRNYLHGRGSSSGIMFYGETAMAADGYYDMLVENNVIANVDGSNCMRVYDCGNNQIFRNNLFMARYYDKDGDGEPDQTALRHSTAFVRHSTAASFTGQQKIYNNIGIGTFSVGTSSQDLKNNYVFSSNQGSNWNHLVPAEPSNFTAMTGLNSGDWDHMEDGVSFFANTSKAVFEDADLSKAIDFAFISGSPGINFGDASLQAPGKSLGSIGPDGFLQDDGVERSASVHSVGPYEFVGDVPNDAAHEL